MMAESPASAAGDADSAWIFGQRITRLLLGAAAAATGTRARWRRRGSGQAAAEAGRGARLTRQSGLGKQRGGRVVLGSRRGRRLVGRKRPRKLRYCPAAWLASKIAHDHNRTKGKKKSKILSCLNI
jgi:hypothetical protein